MLEDFSSCLSRSSSEPEDRVSLRPLLLLLDRLRGNTERAWSMKDSLELFREGCKRELVGVGVVVMPKRVLTSNELLNPDKNGDRLPPKVATKAAY